VIALQASLAVFSVQVTSAVRSYSTGESLYSKGQKDAQIHLLDYVEFQREEDYQAFSQALSAPVADRAAREALEQARPDYTLARRAFLAGGNHPDDIDGLIWLYRWFNDSRLMSGAILSWKEGDQAIEEMQRLANSLHAALQGSARDTRSVADFRAQAARINTRLTGLEQRFSAQLAAATREAQRWVIALNVAVAGLLSLIGLFFVRQRRRERESAEHEIRRRQQQLQLLLDSAAEGLFGVDTVGRCTFINRSALVMLGYQSEADVIGREMHSLIHPDCNGGAPSPASACRLDAALRRREAVYEPGESFKHRDGQRFPVELWSHPMSQDDMPNGAVVTFFDISERVRIQDALRQSEGRLAELIDTVADAVISMDGAGNIQFFNRSAERIFRRQLAGMVGQPFNELITPASGVKLASLLNDLVRPTRAEGPASSVQELTCLRADGEEFPSEATVSRLETDQGVLMTVVLRDVSEQVAVRQEREARLALEHSNRERTLFLSRMSHELRTPLNAVLGFAQLMSIDTLHTLDPDNRARVKHIERAGSHLLALVNDVLDLSMVESGKLSLSLETVDAPAVADEALAVVAPLARDHGISLEKLMAYATVDPPGSTVDGNRVAPIHALGAWVQADRVRLRQILINLLSNAIKYSPHGTQVTLSLRPAGEVCRVIVADTGVGMTSEQLAHLFEPFNRLGAERSTVDGTGIGLVLTRQLVELMGGQLSIDSSHGNGTVATVTLPRGVVPTRPQKLPLLSAGAEGHAGPLDVMYAEDNEVNIELMRQVASLRPAITFRHATSGARAHELARRHPPHLMLVDMNLGDTTGLQLAKALRDDPATAHIHLVALSADAMPGQIRDALNGGFENYLTKPIDFIEILRVFDSYSLRYADAERHERVDAKFSI